MVALKKWLLTKKEYIMIVTVWNAVATYIPVHFQFSPETIVLILTIGNAVIAWLSTEEHPDVAG